METGRKRGYRKREKDGERWMETEGEKEEIDGERKKLIERDGGRDTEGEKEEIEREKD